ncbi:MAG: fatty acid desaturase [Planctomycetota bacterium]
MTTDSADGTSYHLRGELGLGGASSIDDLPLTPDDVLIDATDAEFREAATRLPLPDSVRRGRLNWPYVITIGGLHVLALAAVIPWLFTWTGLIVALIGVHVFGQAINLCYHRLLAHKSAVVPKWLEHTFVVFALCCFQDTPAKWIAMHRIHHKHSDHQPDPHSPLVSFLWSHVGWLLVRNEGTHSVSAYQKYASDVLRDDFYMSLEKSYKWLWIWVAHVIMFFVAGAIIGWAASGTAIEAMRVGLSMLVWGVVVRTILVWHITWSVNSLTHIFGYSNYETDDHSRNNWLVAVLSVGEGWHNNHHHDPVSASNQRRWWEFDITYYQIKLLEKMGLASKVVPPRHVRRSLCETEQQLAAPKMNGPRSSAGV